MSILGNIVQAIRGGLSETGEGIVDKNLVRILEQDIRDDKEAINKAKASLSQLKGKEIMLGREAASLNAEVEGYEASAIEALNQGNEALATEVAERISLLENERDAKKEQHTALSTEVNKINALIKKRNETLAENERELAKVKTVEQLQKTRASVKDNIAFSGKSGSRVKESLARVKEKQASFMAAEEAGDWMSAEENGDNLDKKLAEAGIGSSGSTSNSVLERLKKQKSQ